MRQQDTIESQVARVVLQQDETIKVGKKTYQVAPPTTATLILVSEQISRLPAVKLDTEQIAEESLQIAKECRVVGDIIATMILGAKKKKALDWRYWMYKQKHETLSNELLTEMTPKELHTLMALLLQKLELGDFFAVTTFLTEINLIRPTKVVTETTAYGQS